MNRGHQSFVYCMFWVVFFFIIQGCHDNDSPDIDVEDASPRGPEDGLDRIMYDAASIEPLSEGGADIPDNPQTATSNIEDQRVFDGGAYSQDSQLGPGAGFSVPDPDSSIDGEMSSDEYAEEASLEQPENGIDTTHQSPDSEPDCCLQGIGGDYTDLGPYKVTTRDVEVPGNGMYTLFYPSNFEYNCSHPIAAWGNGTGVSGSATYTHFNKHAASWGIVVIASHSSQSISQPFLEAGIEWLLSQNDDANSEFYQKLSTRAGAAGHSQGGRACTAATFHPNVYAAVSVQGGNEPSPDAAFMCLTGVADVARERCTQSYEDADGPAFLADHEEADHMSTPTRSGIGTLAGIQYVRLHTAWYRCFLAYDEYACQLFRGDPCPICSEPGWARIEGKNM